MELHEALDVAQAQKGLLSECMMASFFEVEGAELDIRCVLLLVQIFANLHYLVQVVLLAIDLDRLLVLARLDIQISCFFPVVGVALEFGLFDENLRIQIWLVACSVLSVFTDEFFGFSELFE